MAKKPTPTLEDDALGEAPHEFELDNAIDSLRGVLKSDEAGGDFDFGADAGGGFGSDIGGGSFGGDFGGGDFGGGLSDDASGHRAPGSALTANHDLIMDIPIDVQIVLGSSRMQVASLMNLEEGAIIALDKRIGEPVDITVNGRKIARGEITILDGDDTRFGVKLLEVLGTRKS
jgi:flagellar motor switch protein FliN/FliY